MQVKTDFFVQIVHNSSFLYISHPFVQQIDAFLLEKGKRLQVRMQKTCRIVEGKAGESRGKGWGKSKESRAKAERESGKKRFIVGLILDFNPTVKPLTS